MTTKEINELVYLGPEGTYSQMAAEKFVSDSGLNSLVLTNMRSIKSIIKLLDENDDKIGILPIENSIEGIVRETIDNLTFTKDNLKIVAELVIDVNNCLLTKQDTKFENIKNVISYTQPLAQCREYLHNHFSILPNLINASSTADAAKQLLELDDTYAAIANKKAAMLYNLKIIDENINDEKGNKTRFIVLAKFETKPTGNDKTSIVFSTKNIAGALSNVLNVFKQHNINLSYIDSRPSKKNLKEYNFYIDFNGHVEDENIKLALAELKQYINFYKHNGSYAVGC